MNHSFINTESPNRLPQILDLFYQGFIYHFNLLHVSREEHLNEAGKRRQIAGHRHDVYHLVLYTKGTNQFLINNSPCQLRPGTLALTGPEESHCFSPCSPGVTCYTELTLEYITDGPPLPFNAMLDLYAGFDLPRMTVPLFLTTMPRKALQGQFDLLIHQLEYPGSRAWLSAFRAIMDILNFLIEEICAGAEAETRADMPLDKVKLEIEHRFRERLQIENLAALAHLSPGYLIREFHKRFGMPPIAYQQTVRVMAAKNLLRNSHLLCKEIAFRTGFDDVYYFSKIFKRITGMAPTQFRKRA